MQEGVRVRIGGVDPTPVGNKIQRLSILLWGLSGVGKTTLAATMPGRKALINFDPDGTSSITHINDLDVFDLSGSTHSITSSFKGTDPLSIKSAIQHYDSVIIDSLTSIEDRTFDQGLSRASQDKNNVSDIERPSQAVYLTRNNLLHHLVRVVVSVTGEAKKHICLIAHEQPKVNKDGQEVRHTLALGGQLVYKVPMNVNECIALRQVSGKRELVIVSDGVYMPIKTRMFTTTAGEKFSWKYNVDKPDDPDNMGLDQMYNAWQANGFRKIPLPGTKAYDIIRNKINE